MGREETLLVLTITLSFILVVHGGFGRPSFGTVDPELKKQMKLDGIVKIVETKHDVIRCVDVYKQPGFNHPLLRNHTLQWKPITIPNELENEISFEGGNAMDLSSENSLCPENTIPIRQTMKKNLDYIAPNADHNTSVYRVYPEIYGDSQTRLSKHWSVDGSHGPGCHDLLCPGFIQVDNNVTLGLPFLHFSKHDDPSLYSADFYIFQDVSTQNWWFASHTSIGKLYIGYWPSELFPRLGGGATLLHFGGSAMAQAGQHFPPMGDGYFPNRDPKRSNFFKQIQYVNKSNYLVPPRSLGARLHTDNPNCYGLIYDEQAGKNFNRTLFMGGPGGQC